MVGSGPGTNRKGTSDMNDTTTAKEALLNILNDGDEEGLTVHLFCTTCGVDVSDADAGCLYDDIYEITAVLCSVCMAEHNSNRR
jgi:hypothetical protein